VIADVDKMLPVVQCVLADSLQREHRLKLSAIPVTKPGEAQLPGIPQMDDPPGNRRGHTRRCTGLQAGVGVPQLGQGMGPLKLHRVRLTAALQQLTALVPADPHLLGEIVIVGFGVNRLVDHERQA
jgi:hypothetical protein